MVTARSARVAPFALFAALLPGCATDSFVEMVHVTPRDGYEERLADFRARRDVYFAEDDGSPLLADERKTFDGLEYFDPDLSLYFVGDLRFYVEPQTLQMVTTSGKIRDAERVGFVAFRIAGRLCNLQVYRLADGSGGLFLPFQDATTGSETYGAGRYIDLIPSSRSGPYELDFNVAYNPSCAYGEADRFVCPVTPVENRLDVRIAAGERGRAEVPVKGGG